MTFTAKLTRPLAALFVSVGLTSTAGAESAPSPATQAAFDPIPAELMEEGARQYKRHCRFCHGSKGTAGLRLKGNEKMRDGAFVAHAILVGPGYMTPFEDALTDEEIAIITTFVRNAWGNDYGPMTAEEVAQLRQ